MSAGRQIPGLRIALRPSIELAALLAGVHVCAAGLLLYALPSLPWGSAACGWLGINALWTIPRAALQRHDQAVVGVELAAENECVLMLRNGSRSLGRIRSSTYVSTWLIVLALDVPESRFGRRIVVWRDSAPADALRRLRVRLRWARLEAAHAAAEAPL